VKLTPNSRTGARRKDRTKPPAFRRLAGVGPTGWPRRLARQQPQGSAHHEVNATGALSPVHASTAPATLPAQPSIADGQRPNAAGGGRLPAGHTRPSARRTAVLSTRDLHFAERRASIGVVTIRRVRRTTPPRPSDLKHHRVVTPPTRAPRKGATAMQDRARSHLCDHLPVPPDIHDVLLWRLAVDVACAHRPARRSPTP
jgi:hypothetical protein